MIFLKTQGHFGDLGDLRPSINSMERKPLRGFALLLAGLAYGGPSTRVCSCGARYKENKS